ncbi:MAG: hypothetical protein CHACPFDD_03172 [Phycisphaerae bacterium]|nr:hypothetical protein [Phycisphaerae bacterium]
MKGSPAPRGGAAGAVLGAGGALAARIAAVRTSPHAVLAVASLFGAGSAPAVCLALHELDLHATTPGSGALAGMAALGAGFIGGLWLPRRLIVRNVGLPVSSGRLLGRVGAAGVGVATEFAALVVGVLMLALGAFLGGGVLVAAEAERWRAVLGADVTLPGGVKLLMLWCSAVAGLTLCGALGAMVLTALYGWRKAASGARYGDWPFWVTVVSSAAIGAAVTALWSESVAIAAGFLVPVFAGGMLSAVSRPAGAAGGGGPRPAAAAGGGAPWRYVALLLGAGASWGALASGGILQRAAAGARLEHVLAVLLAGAAGGTALARVVFERGVGTRRATLVALVAAALLASLPLNAAEFPAAHLLRLGAASVALAVVAALADARLGSRLGSRQLALAFEASAVLCGAGGASAVTLIGGVSHADGAVGGVIAALTALLLGRSGVGLPVRRFATVATVALALVNVGRMVWPRGAHDADPGAPAGGGWLIDALLADTRSRAMFLEARPPDVWRQLAQIDLAGTAHDVIRVPCSARALDCDAAAERDGRLIERCLMVLPLHGKLIIERPTESAALTLFGTIRRRSDAWEVFFADSAAAEGGGVLIVSRGAAAGLERVASAAGRRLVRIQGTRQFLAARRAVEGSLTRQPVAR